jgi:hypothetical protein
MYNPPITKEEKIENMKEENILRRKEYYQLMDKIGDFPIIVLKEEIMYWDRYIRWCEDNW